MVRTLLEKVENSEEIKITVVDAIGFIDESWKKEKDVTIRNSFWKIPNLFFKKTEDDGTTGGYDGEFD